MPQQGEQRYSAAWVRLGERMKESRESCRQGSGMRTEGTKKGSLSPCLPEPSWRFRPDEARVCAFRGGAVCPTCLP